MWLHYPGGTYLPTPVIILAVALALSCGARYRPTEWQELETTAGRALRSIIETFCDLAAAHVPFMALSQLGGMPVQVLINGRPSLFVE